MRYVIEMTFVLIQFLFYVPTSAQGNPTQHTSPNNELSPESNSLDHNASSPSIRKNLRPRSTQKEGEQIPRSKTRSRKRNVFTEDEADEDEKERYCFEGHGTNIYKIYVL